MVTVWVIGVGSPWLVPVAVKVMGKMPVVMGMKWSGPQAVSAVATMASSVSERMARRAERRLRARPMRPKKLRGNRAARATRVECVSGRLLADSLGERV
jgi:hypothetical protein